MIKVQETFEYSGLKFTIELRELPNGETVISVFQDSENKK